MLITSFHFCANLSCLLFSASCSVCSNQLPPEGGATAATVLLKSRNQVSGVSDELFNPVIIICSHPCLKKPDVGLSDHLCCLLLCLLPNGPRKEGPPQRNQPVWSCGGFGGDDRVLLLPETRLNCSELFYLRFLFFSSL